MNRVQKSGEALRSCVKDALPGADDTTLDILTAVTGLLAVVAYADRTISGAESRHLRAELGRIHGMSTERVDAVARVLEEHALVLNTSYAPRFTRTLRDELPEEMRAEILDALLSMAASDGSITYDEITNLRNITHAMGLTQTHYNELQQKYRQHLAL